VARKSPWDRRNVARALQKIDRDHTVCTWDVATGRLKSRRKLDLPTNDPDANPHTVLSPTGELFAFTNKTGVTIHDTATGKQRHRVADSFPDPGVVVRPAAGAGPL
jgi:hypothetical protein